MNDLIQCCEDNLKLVKKKLEEKKDASALGSCEELLTDVENLLGAIQDRVDEIEAEDED